MLSHVWPNHLQASSSSLHQTRIFFPISTNSPPSPLLLSTFQEWHIKETIVAPRMAILSNRKFNLEFGRFSWIAFHLAKILVCIYISRATPSFEQFKCKIWNAISFQRRPQRCRTMFQRITKENYVELEQFPMSWWNCICLGYLCILKGNKSESGAEETNVLL